LALRAGAPGAGGLPHQAPREEHLGEPPLRARLPRRTHLPEDFPRRFDKNLPGIATVQPDIRKSIEDRQPWERRYEWLGHLHGLHREQGHNDLTPQTKAWDAKIEINPDNPNDIRLAPGADLPLRPGESIRVLAGVAGDPPDADPSIPRLKPGDTLQAVFFVDWLFTQLGISVLATLETIQRENPRLIAQVRQVAGV
jgi:hypothetical protein